MRRCLPLPILIAAFLHAQAASAQFGIALSGAGPINRSMGGASTAAPLDAAGALYWNPATISGLPRSELEFGAEFLYPQTRLSSVLPANSLGAGVPPITLSGSDRSDNGVFPLPTVGLVYRPDGSPWTYGLGFFSAGGFAVNYPASATNPILTPQPPAGLGLGSLAAELQVAQIVPTVSFQLTNRLSFGFAPTISMARLTLNPALLAPPDNANGDLFATYAPGTNTRLNWGVGFQTGLFYRGDNGWNWGASLKSPQWFQAFRYNSHNELGQPRTLDVRFDYPLMASLGASFTGFQRWTLAADARWIDYRNTRGFEQSGFDATGAVRGLGWRSVFALALGAQYLWSENVTIRGGYTFNTSPISDANSSFNAASPLILQHTVYTGASYRLTDNFLVSFAYAHAFENSVDGPLILPFGAVPGSSVRSDVSADTVMFGATVNF